MGEYFYFNMKIFLAAFCVVYLNDSSPDEDQIKNLPLQKKKNEKIGDKNLAKKNSILIQSLGRKFFID